jgi:hypothetical protein
MGRGRRPHPALQRLRSLQLAAVAAATAYNWPAILDSVLDIYNSAGL